MMKFVEAMTAYFHGEKTEALVFILPMGLLSLVFGGWLLSEKQGGFVRGVAIPFLMMGVVLSVVGGVVGYRTPSQVEHLRTAVSAQPETALSKERARMTKVNQAWPAYLALWAAFGAGGLILRFATKSDFSQGLGVALVFFSGLGLLVDGFAERRARPYTEALSAMPPPTSPAR